MPMCASPFLRRGASSWSCTTSDNDFEGGELDTVMAPTIIKRIDFAAGNSVEV